MPSEAMRRCDDNGFSGVIDRLQTPMASNMTVGASLEQATYLSMGSTLSRKVKKKKKKKKKKRGSDDVSFSCAGADADGVEMSQKASNGVACDDFNRD